MLISTDRAKELAKEYNIPVEDVILIAFNCCGAKADIPEKRIRFNLKLNTSAEVFNCAVGINTRETPFSIKNSILFLNNEPIATIAAEENDSCDSSYFRRNKTVLVLNSNSSAKCYGCRFCKRYNPDIQDQNDLLTNSQLSDHIQKILTRNNLRDCSKLVYVCICTGCFKDQKSTIKHILMVRNVLRNFGFNKEIIYIGSQITSEKGMKIIKDNAAPFSFYLTLECFKRREQLLRYHKAKITISEAKKIMKLSVNNGFPTSFLYILGLDPLDDVIYGFKQLLPFIDRFPTINLLQNFSSEDEILRTPEAKNIEHYLTIRKKMEEIFRSSNLRPKPWENYRPLWYLSFNNKPINDIRI